MEEKVLIRATFSKNIKAYLLIVLGFAIAIAGFTYQEPHFESVSRWSGDWYDLYLGYLIAIAGFVVAALAILLCCLMNYCALTITNFRVSGKGSFGKVVDLPLNKISAVGLGWFSRMSVATASGSIHFWLIKNRDEVYDILNAELQKQQKETKSEHQQNSNADELKKYKDLLDSGVITQEEFDAKKKQILGI